MDNIVLYDTIILGGGPAGVAAAVYAARKKMKTLLITEGFGGQSLVASDIENWIGEEHISGFELAVKLENHVKKYKDEVTIKMPATVMKVEKIDCKDGSRECDFRVTTQKGEEYFSKTVILALGAKRRKLSIPGEDQLEGTGVSYCATCDAPLFKDKDVVVVGGGNAGVEAALDLLSYAQHITIFQRGPVLTADQTSVEEVKKNNNIDILLGVSVKEIIGSKTVEGIIYQDADGSKHTLNVDGVFVEIGSIPNSGSVKEIVELDEHGQVRIDSRHGNTSQPGIFAAGDITDDPYKQNNISAGDAVKAALAAYSYLQKLPKRSPAEERA